MRYKIVQYEEDMYANFWIVPLVMSLVALGLAFFFLYLDATLDFKKVKDFFTNFLAAKSGRDVLSIITGATITITSVTFSITILILSISSNQLGPRLLPNFIRQKTTQVVIGIFIGTFVYCLIILQSLSTSDEGSSFAYLSITFGILLGIISFFMLIYFIHFVCHVIQIDNVLTFLVEDLIICLNRQYNDRQTKIDRIQNTTLSFENAIAKYRNKQLSYTTKLVCDNYGYLQTIDYKKIYNLADEHGLQIQVEFAIGQFILEGLPVMLIRSDMPVDEHIQKSCLNAIHLGKRRSTVQDIEFAFEQISEVAIRALSPGENNPYTAVHCLDRIAQSFGVLAGKRMPTPILFNTRGEAVVIRKITGFKEIVGTTFNRLRQQAQTDLSVAIHTLNVIERLFKLNIPDALKKPLIEQAVTIYEAASAEKISDIDRKDLDAFYQKIQSV